MGLALIVRLNMLVAFEGYVSYMKHGATERCYREDEPLHILQVRFWMLCRSKT